MYSFNCRIFKKGIEKKGRGKTMSKYKIKVIVKLYTPAGCFLQWEYN